MSQTISAHKIHFMYPGMSQPLIDEASFQIQLDGGLPSRIGLIGPNGHGKTTLIHLLRREFQPDAGTLSFPTTPPVIAYLPQSLLDASLHVSLQQFVLGGLSHYRDTAAALARVEEELATVSEPELPALLEEYSDLQDAFEAAGGYGLQAHIDEVMSALGVASLPQDSMLSDFSVGQQMRAALARMLLMQASAASSGATLLVLDEPTNHLDIAAKKWLSGYLRVFPGAMLIVSHDRAFLDEVVDQIWRLQYQEFETYEGNYSEYLDFCDRRHQRRLHEYQVQQREVKRLERSAAQRQGWSDKKEQTKFGHGPVDRGQVGARAAKQAKRAQHALRRIEQELEDRRKAMPLIDKRVSLAFPVSDILPAGAVIHQWQAADLGYEKEEVSTPVLEDVHWSLRSRDRIGIIGPNGAGKTTFLSSIAGSLRLLRGVCKQHPRMQLHYYTQEHTELWAAGLATGCTILDAIGAHVSFEQAQVRTLLAHLGFKRDVVFRPLRVLSPGQLARVALARALLSGANVLLLDEPTNHLDLPAREALEEGLRRYEGALVCVSHDVAFLDAIDVERLALEGWSG